MPKLSDTRRQQTNQVGFLCFESMFDFKNESPRLKAVNFKKATSYGQSCRCSIMPCKLASSTVVPTYSGGRRNKWNTMMHAMYVINKSTAACPVPQWNSRQATSRFRRKAFCASAIRSEPKMHLCCDNEEKKANQSKNEPLVKENFCKQKGGGDRGDLLIRNLWSNGTNCIIDVRCTDTDSKSYKGQRSYGGPCTERERDAEEYVLNTLAPPATPLATIWRRA